MEENRRRWRGGREVPGAGGGKAVKWIDISVPSPCGIDSNSTEDDGCVVLPSSSSSEDYASSLMIGEPPISFVWRINQTSSNVMEVLQLSSKSGYPLTGIRFAFAHRLSPFAFPFVAQEGSASGPLAFFLYAVTPSGVVYVLNLSNALAYTSGSVFHLIHVVVDVRPYLNEAQAHVTSVTASPGFIFLGRSDGCVSFFQPFVPPQEPSSGFNQELRDDDTGFLRRLGFCLSPGGYGWFTFEKFISFSLYPGYRNIPLQGGGLRDVRFTSDTIWILKADELISQMLPHKSSNRETQSYMLQEEYISEQLFLRPASSSHDLRLTTHSLFSSAKDRIMGFISSIFLGRLLCLGIFDNVALRLTLRDHNKRWSNSEFQSLSLDELKSEILLLIEQEVTGQTSISVFRWWERFCSTYLDHWRNNNEPRTLLVQSDVIGLVRNNSVSLFFRSENAERSHGGPSSEHSNLTSLGSGMSTDEHEILSEVLNCTLKISKQLGTAPYAMYFESVTGKSVISSEEILSRLVNILESGYAMSIGRTWSDLGADRARERLDLGKSSILVQATSLFAKVMFESAFDIVLLLSYLLNISAQVNMSQQDISNLRLKLLPMIQDIVSEWLIILLFVTTPAGSTSMNDCSFKPSSLQIDSSIDKRSWNKMLGKCGFSLAYILLLSDRREDSSSLLRRSSELTLRVVRNGHAYAVERILEVVEGSLRGEKTFGHGQDTSGDWCLLQHLRGCCLLDQVQRGACGILLREKKISDATRCFFRASSGEGSWKALHSLATEAGFSHSTIGTSISDGEKSCATWKLHYYEWAKQIFERYNISEGACEFACAALEQVDEAISFLESSENVRVPVTATLGLKKRSLTSRARKE
ncbi:hypothetical protein Bca4012_033389 [Brassica carinata]